MRYLTLLLILTLVAAAQVPVADWPQFLGPTRNGVYAGPALAESWPAAGPRVVWRKQVGEGFSGPVVVQGRVILFHRVNGRETVEALDSRTSATQWKYDYPTVYRDDFGFDEGPRAGDHPSRQSRKPFGMLCQVPTKEFEEAPNRRISMLSLLSVDQPNRVALDDVPDSLAWSQPEHRTHSGREGRLRAFCDLACYHGLH